MGTRKISITNGEYYHFYNRGNSKQIIFIDNQDYDRFVKLLFLCNSKKSINFRIDVVEKGIDAWEFDREEPITSICAWVLMPNHFHLYIKAENYRKPATSISSKQVKNGAILFMQKIGTAYAKYFNTKYARTGSLFEGKFKSKQVTNDGQARYLFSYIHLNPVKLIQSNWKEVGIEDKRKAFEYVQDYEYSSLKDWLGFSRKESSIINKDILNHILPQNFSPSEDIFQWLSYHNDENE